MTVNLDPNVIAVALIKDIATSLLATGDKLVTDHLSRYSAAFSKDFQKYYVNSFKNYSHIKTLLNREKPVSIESQYIPARFKQNTKLIYEKDFHTFISNNKKVAIVGTAGSGKSVFLKHYFLTLLKDPKGRIPILVELRHLDLDSDISIETWLLHIIKATLAYMNESILDAFLSGNKIVLLLDGYDEIDFELRQKFEKQLLLFCQKYPDIHLILTTRPEETLYAWESISVLEILPLTKEDAIALIGKFDYPDEDVKTKFAKHVATKLYFSHRSFISNPLLLSMLLLTYEQIAEIPDKLHIFYEQAFEALYQKHDALKRQYRRRLYTNLASCLLSVILAT
jgi:predicted NACHT family NTPase